MPSSSDAAAADQPTRRFGEGAFPQELDRLNWAAFLLGGIWALVHGTWGWFWLFAMMRVALFSLAGILRVASMGVPAVAAWAVGTAVADWVLCAIFGMRANEAAWSSESKRLASGRAQPPALTWTVATFERRQRMWLYLGVLLLVMGYALNWTGASAPAFRSATPYSIFVALGAAGLLYAVDRSRQANKRIDADKPAV